MLFMGSKRFSGDITNFLAKHGGSSNGFTEKEHTILYLHVKPDYLKPTLERFSDFLIAPVLDPALMAKEICAIDSEYNTHKENNFNLIEGLRAHTSKKGHIFNRFCCGNKESLSNANPNLGEHAKKLFDECFSGGAMKLCVIGGEDLDTLESWVRRFFGPIRKGPPKTIHIPAFNIREPIWDASISYGLQIKAGHILEISWILPPLSPNFYLERPEQYLVKLLNQQGKGSLFAFFKNEGWANSLNVVPFDGCNCTSVGCLFIISMNLTLSGLEKRYELISYTYQYLMLGVDPTPTKGPGPGKSP
ncbi:PREDICTED: nardilysin-like [Camelina sativa]|uniref:Nardilysin-like n=1 Tax=Camelina sativa TaxID=90675 RepID=A0ABM0Y7S1_CAMSA|nr:PREDICTED: nardilysin-like [Camelina sativa]